MKLTVQKILASKILKCSPKRVKLAPDHFSDISKAITRMDVADLIEEGLIQKIPAKGVSRVRARKSDLQRAKGLRKGPGRHKAKKTARSPKKQLWMVKIRLLRAFLKELKTKKILSQENYKDLYHKAKGGFFRNKRHVKIYMEEHNLGRK